MSRTLSEQFGLKPDPHAPQHFKHPSGNRLTKVVSRGGHEIDSQQPGLPVYHRRIANPFPVFAISIGASLMILGLVYVNARGLQNAHVSLNAGLPLGGIATLTAAMFAFAEGNTFLATAAGTLGGLAGGINIIFLPWTGIPQAYSQSPEDLLQLSRATGVLFLCAMVPVFIIFMASLKTAVPVSFAALLIVIALIIQGAAYLNPPMIDTTKTCGALFIMIGIVLFFSATAVLLTEEGITLLPVMPLPRMET